jgi:hypothetical protein
MADVDPRTLEQIPGMCYVIDGDASPMKARMSYIPDGELYDLLHDDDNNLIGYPAEIPAETLEAFGPEWADWQRCRASGVQWKPKPADVTAAVAKPKAGAQEAVLAVIAAANGPVQFNDVVARSGYSTSSCTAALKALTAADGGVVKDNHGLYRLAD